MDGDLNKFDLNHRVSHHPKMSDNEWDEAYRAAWQAYYTPEHVRTIFRRVAALRPAMLNSITSTVLWFKTMVPIEGVHPLEGGVLRLKFRRDRRPGLPIESRWVFYDRLAREMARKLRSYWSTYRTVRAILKEVKADPNKAAYVDVAMMPDTLEFEGLALYHETDGGEAALERKHRDDAIRAGVRVHGALEVVASKEARVVPG
jgi:ketosteroid isomerase-like protein